MNYKTISSNIQSNGYDKPTKEDYLKLKALIVASEFFRGSIKKRNTVAKSYRELHANATSHNGRDACLHRSRVC